jgi:ribosomal protein L37AE/L43A
MTYKQNNVVEMPQRTITECSNCGSANTSVAGHVVTCNACGITINERTHIAPTYEQLQKMLNEIENSERVNLLEIALLAQEMSLHDKTSSSAQLAKDKEELFNETKLW